MLFSSRDSDSLVLSVHREKLYIWLFGHFTAHFKNILNILQDGVKEHMGLYLILVG